MDSQTLNGMQKAAVLMVALGVEASARVFKELEESEIEVLVGEISRLKNVPGRVASDVLQEFQQMALAQEYIARGGKIYAEELLEKAMGKTRATEIIARVHGLKGAALFTALRKVDARFLIESVRQEHPQTIALVLSHMDPKLSASVLVGLPQDVRSEVIIRIAKMDKTNPELVGEVDQILAGRLSSVLSQEVSLTGGIKPVAEILNFMDRATEHGVLENLQASDPPLADEIRKLMFTFDDLTRVDDRGIQRVLKEVDQKELALALKAAGQEVADKISKNMSERARGLLEEEIGYLGPVRLRDVEAAQQKIVSVVRQLEEAGEILVRGRTGGEEEVIV
jgi:flagellar motor switch protein FliG